MKPRKVEGLRSALPSLPTVFQGKPPELDEPGLVGVYVQFEPSKPFLYGVQPGYLTSVFQALDLRSVGLI